MKSWGDKISYTIEMKCCFKMQTSRIVLLRSFKPLEHPNSKGTEILLSTSLFCVRELDPDSIYFDLKFYKWTLCIYSLRKTWETRLKMDQTRKVLIKIHSGWWIKTILLDLFQNKNQMISKERSKQKRPRPNGFRKYCSTFT